MRYFVTRTIELFVFLGFTATEKSLAESKAYTDGKTTELATS